MQLTRLSVQLIDGRLHWYYDPTVTTTTHNYHHNRCRYCNRYKLPILCNWTSWRCWVLYIRGSCHMQRYANLCKWITHSPKNVAPLTKTLAILDYFLKDWPSHAVDRKQWKNSRVSQRNYVCILICGDLAIQLPNFPGPIYYGQAIHFMHFYQLTQKL